MPSKTATVTATPRQRAAKTATPVAATPKQRVSKAAPPVVEKPQQRVGAKCTIAKMLDAITETDNRQWIADVIDGTNADYPMPADAAAVARSMGFEISTGIVRRHRRRLVGHGEMCWCPR